MSESSKSEKSSKGGSKSSKEGGGERSRSTSRDSDHNSNHLGGTSGVIVHPRLDSIASNADILDLRRRNSDSSLHWPDDKLPFLAGAYSSESLLGMFPGLPFTTNPMLDVLASKEAREEVDRLEEARRAGLRAPAFFDLPGMFNSHLRAPGIEHFNSLRELSMRYMGHDTRTDGVHPAFYPFLPPSHPAFSYMSMGLHPSDAIRALDPRIDPTLPPRSSSPPRKERHNDHKRDLERRESSRDSRSPKDSESRNRRESSEGRPVHKDKPKTNGIVEDLPERSKSREDYEHRSSPPAKSSSVQDSIYNEDDRRSRDSHHSDHRDYHHNEFNSDSNSAGHIREAAAEPIFRPPSCSSSDLLHHGHMSRSSSDAASIGESAATASRPNSAGSSVSNKSGQGAVSESHTVPPLIPSLSYTTSHTTHTTSHNTTYTTTTTTSTESGSLLSSIGAYTSLISSPTVASSSTTTTAIATPTTTTSKSPSHGKDSPSYKAQSSPQRTLDHTKYSYWPMTKKQRILGKAPSFTPTKSPNLSPTLNRQRIDFTNVKRQSEDPTSPERYSRKAHLLQRTKPIAKPMNAMSKYARDLPFLSRYARSLFAPELLQKFGKPKPERARKRISRRFMYPTRIYSLRSANKKEDEKGPTDGEEEEGDKEGKDQAGEKSERPEKKERNEKAERRKAERIERRRASNRPVGRPPKKGGKKSGKENSVSPKAQELPTSSAVSTTTTTTATTVSTTSLTTTPCVTTTMSSSTVTSVVISTQSAKAKPFKPGRAMSKIADALLAAKVGENISVLPKSLDDTVAPKDKGDNNKVDFPESKNAKWSRRLSRKEEDGKGTNNHVIGKANCVDKKGDPDAELLRFIREGHSKIQASLSGKTDGDINNGRKEADLSHDIAILANNKDLHLKEALVVLKKLPSDVMCKVERAKEDYVKLGENECKTLKEKAEKCEVKNESTPDKNIRKEEKHEKDKQEEAKLQKVDTVLHNESVKACAKKPARSINKLTEMLLSKQQETVDAASDSRNSEKQDKEEAASPDGSQDESAESRKVRRKGIARRLVRTAADSEESANEDRTSINEQRNLSNEAEKINENSSQSEDCALKPPSDNVPHVQKPCFEQELKSQPNDEASAQEQTKENKRSLASGAASKDNFLDYVDKKRRKKSKSEVKSSADSAACQPHSIDNILKDIVKTGTNAETHAKVTASHIDLGEFHYESMADRIKRKSSHAVKGKESDVEKDKSTSGISFLYKKDETEKSIAEDAGLTYLLPAKKRRAQSKSKDMDSKLDNEESSDAPPKLRNVTDSDNESDNEPLRALCSLKCDKTEPPILEPQIDSAPPIIDKMTDIDKHSELSEPPDLDKTVDKATSRKRKKSKSRKTKVEDIVTEIVSNEIKTDADDTSKTENLSRSEEVEGKGNNSRDSSSKNKHRDSKKERDSSKSRSKNKSRSSESTKSGKQSGNKDLLDLVKLENDKVVAAKDLVTDNQDSAEIHKDSGERSKMTVVLDNIKSDIDVIDTNEKKSETEIKHDKKKSSGKKSSQNEKKAKSSRKDKSKRAPSVPKTEESQDATEKADLSKGDLRVVLKKFSGFKEHANNKKDAVETADKEEADMLQIPAKDKKKCKSHLVDGDKEGKASLKIVISGHDPMFIGSPSPPLPAVIHETAPDISSSPEISEPVNSEKHELLVTPALTKRGKKRGRKKKLEVESPPEAHIELPEENPERRLPKRNAKPPPRLEYTDKGETKESAENGAYKRHRVDSESSEAEAPYGAYGVAYAVPEIGVRRTQLGDVYYPTASPSWHDSDDENNSEEDSETEQDSTPPQYKPPVFKGPIKLKLMFGKQVLEEKVIEQPVMTSESDESPQKAVPAPIEVTPPLLPPALPKRVYKNSDEEDNDDVVSDASSGDTYQPPNKVQKRVPFARRRGRKKKQSESEAPPPPVALLPPPCLATLSRHRKSSLVSQPSMASSDSEDPFGKSQDGEDNKISIKISLKKDRRGWKRAYRRQCEEGTKGAVYDFDDFDNPGGDDEVESFAKRLEKTTSQRGMPVLAQLRELKKKEEPGAPTPTTPTAPVLHRQQSISQSPATSANSTHSPVGSAFSPHGPFSPHKSPFTTPAPVSTQPKTPIYGPPQYSPGVSQHGPSMPVTSPAQPVLSPATHSPRLPGYYPVTSPHTTQPNQYPITSPSTQPNQYPVPSPRTSQPSLYPINSPHTSQAHQYPVNSPHTSQLNQYAVTSPVSNPPNLQYPMPSPVSTPAPYPHTSPISSSGGHYPLTSPISSASSHSHMSPAAGHHTSPAAQNMYPGYAVTSPASYMPNMTSPHYATSSFSPASTLPSPALRSPPPVPRGRGRGRGRGRRNASPASAEEMPQLPPQYMTQPAYENISPGVSPRGRRGRRNASPASAEEMPQLPPHYMTQPSYENISPGVSPRGRRGRRNASPANAEEMPHLPAHYMEHPAYQNISPGVSPRGRRGRSPAMAEYDHYHDRSNIRSPIMSPPVNSPRMMSPPLQQPQTPGQSMDMYSHQQHHPHAHHHQHSQQQHQMSHHHHPPQRYSTDETVRLRIPASKFVPPEQRIPELLPADADEVQNSEVMPVLPSMHNRSTSSSSESGSESGSEESGDSEDEDARTEQAQETSPESGVDTKTPVSGTEPPSSVEEAKPSPETNTLHKKRDDMMPIRFPELPCEEDFPDTQESVSDLLLKLESVNIPPAPDELAFLNEVDLFSCDSGISETHKDQTPNSIRSGSDHDNNQETNYVRNESPIDVNSFLSSVLDSAGGGDILTGNGTMDDQLQALATQVCHQMPGIVDHRQQVATAQDALATINSMVSTMQRQGGVMPGQQPYHANRASPQLPVLPDSVINSLTDLASSSDMQFIHPDDKDPKSRNRARRRSKKNSSDMPDINVLFSPPSENKMDQLLPAVQDSNDPMDPFSEVPQGNQTMATPSWHGNRTPRADHTMPHSNSLWESMSSVFDDRNRNMMAKNTRRSFDEPPATPMPMNSGWGMTSSMGMYTCICGEVFTDNWAYQQHEAFCTGAL